jgi:hypothetical protein
MRVSAGSKLDFAAKPHLPARQLQYSLASLCAVVSIPLALYAQAQTFETGTTPFSQGAKLASPPTSPLPHLVVDCISIEPAKMQGGPRP